MQDFYLLPFRGIIEDFFRRWQRKRYNSSSRVVNLTNFARDLKPGLKFSKTRNELLGSLHVLYCSSKLMIFSRTNSCNLTKTLKIGKIVFIEYFPFKTSWFGNYTISNEKKNLILFKEFCYILYIYIYIYIYLCVCVSVIIYMSVCWALLNIFLAPDLVGY